MEIVQLNKNNFEDYIKNNGKVIVDFYADWCGPCKMLRPVLDEIASERKDINIVSVNIDNDEELAEKYNVMSIPCVVLFNNGEEERRSIGFKPKDSIESFIGE